MRVLCINNKPIARSHNTINHLLKEGDVYNVEGTEPAKDVNGAITIGYRLREFKIENRLFHPSRFVPLQDSDPMLNREPNAQGSDTTKAETTSKS